MSIKGIDVSCWQYGINWYKVKDNIDFAIIRAGFGQGNIDSRAVYNCRQCQLLGIPFGLYWFSYAYTEDMAKKEAEYLVAFAKEYLPSYPLYFDFEYGSMRYAKSKGHNLTAKQVQNITKAFCKRVEELGYYTGIYANYDYIKNYYGTSIFKTYDLWYAYWNTKLTRSCHLWQYTSKGRVSGINTVVDCNYAFFDFPKAIKSRKLNGYDKYDEYVQVAKDVIANKYGTGAARKKKLQEAGYPYYVIQGLVNEMSKD